MDFQDVKDNFNFFTVTKVRGWNELQLRGKFTTNEDKAHDFTHFCSRWLYRLEVSAASDVVLGIFQMNNEIRGVSTVAPNIDIGLAIYKLQNEAIELLYLVPSKFVREQFKQIYFEKGEYYVLPLSQGLSLQQEPNEAEETEELLMSVAKELFTKLDVKIQGHLTFQDMKNLHEFLETEYSSETFEKSVKKWQLPNQKEEAKVLNEKGFVDYFLELLKSSGNKRGNYLEKLGYHKLHSHRSRAFNLTIHSEKKIKCSTQDALKENLDLQVNSLFIKTYGKRYEKENDERFDCFVY